MQDFARFLSSGHGFVLCLAVTLTGCQSRLPTRVVEMLPGVAYTNWVVSGVPWSIHIVGIRRSEPSLRWVSFHAQGPAFGLGTLTDQIDSIPAELGIPLAAVNGDFYQTNQPYPGDPRGLQIFAGQMVSGPAGGGCFWIDANGWPYMSAVTSRFEVTWPNGLTSPFGLNEDRVGNSVVLYTPETGLTTGTYDGHEFVLEPAEQGPWLPLRPGQTYAARVREIRAADTEIPSDGLVLSVGPYLENFVGRIEPGTLLKLSTATEPPLAGATMALSGGPILIRAGQRQKLVKPEIPGPLPYRYASMWQRHPRTAIGWNAELFFLVVVDGRHKLSAGMTLDELTTFMMQLGCTEAMNLDGGGSATLWCNGQVRNRPSDAPISKLEPGDLLDLQALASAWSNPQDPVSKLIASRLSATATLFLGLQPQATPNRLLEQYLLEELNRLIQGPSLYDARYFAAQPLGPETRLLLGQTKLSPDNRARLNRLLLEDAYPGQVRRSSASRERKVANAIVLVRRPMTGMYSAGSQSFPKQ